MTQAVLWPGVNQLLEAWVLPAATFGRGVGSRLRRARQQGNHRRQVHGQAERCADDTEPWGWLHEYARGMGQILHSGELPPLAFGERMDFVAAMMQVSTVQYVFLKFLLL